MYSLYVRVKSPSRFDKTREKVDYAIKKNGKIVLFIEVKPVHDQLKNHDPQLAKYFNSTPEAKFAIITNGIQYKFHSDLLQPNIIDVLPFFELNIENVTNNDIEILQRFCKESFEVGSLVTLAEELVCYSKIKPEIVNLLRNPSDDLIKLLIKKYISDAKMTPSVIGRYREVVKNAITDALLEMFRQSIMQKDIPSIVKPDAGTNGGIDCSPPTSPPFKKESLPSMKMLFDWKLIKTDDVVYLKNRPEEKAKVIDYKNVNYKGNVLTFNQWGQKVNNWKSIRIYDWVIIEGQTVTLGVLRQNRMLELERNNQ